MYKIRMLFLSIVLAILVIFPVVSHGDKIIGIDLNADVPEGVYCEINDVKLVAQSVDDCTKAGGVVGKHVMNEPEETKDQ